MFPEKKIDDSFSTSQFYLTDGFSSLYRLDRYANGSLTEKTLNVIS